MNIEKWIVAHFSPTGGTKKVADAIAAGFNTPVLEMDLTKADASVSLGENDALMAVLPVYAGRVPQISLENNPIRIVLKDNESPGIGLLQFPDCVFFT